MIKKLTKILKTHKPVIIVSFIYLGILMFASYHHEMWRDEVRVLEPVKESRSVIQLFDNLEDEGHPCLWYLILYFLYGIFKTPVVLKAANIAISFIAVYIFLLKAPFRWFQKVIFVFGYYPLYAYGVFNRNYSLNMLFMFLICVFYKDRFKKPIILALVLFVFSNITPFSPFIAAAILLSLIMESISSRKDPKRLPAGWGPVLISFAIIFSGIVLSILQIIPTEINTDINIYSATPEKVYFALKSIIIQPGDIFSDMAAVNEPLFMTFILWALFLYAARKPYIFAIFFPSVIIMGMFHCLVRLFLMRHYGIVYLLIVMLFWLDEEVREKKIFPFKVVNKINDYIQTNKGSFITLLFLMQLSMCYVPLEADIKLPCSSSKAFGDFIKKNDSLKDAIILGEPDYVLESIAYYVDNKIYIAREKRFGKKIKDTTANKRGFSLDELIDEAETLDKTYHKPVLMLISYDLSPRGPFFLELSQGRIFSYDRNSLKRLMSCTTKIESFKKPSISRENYDVFLFRQPL